ncbi:MAG: MFS transporter [Anaerolineae bacterium]|nr:MFS transporter [Anaerolineae bacterium]
MIDRLRTIYNEYPPKFWILVMSMFIDRVGGTLIFPFISLYVTHKFDVGMTQAGVMLGIFSAAGMAGNLLGGALSDRLGRKVMILFGLVFSALSSLAMGLVSTLWGFYLVAALAGLLSDIAGPAWQAVIADILPEEQRAEGFGVLRVVGNMAWIIGPSIGGFMAARSFLLLFVMDAILSSATALIIFRMLPETMPGADTDSAEPRETIIQTFSGYADVLKDGLYMAYIVVSILMLIVYLQMYNTLSVYLRDVHGISPQGYGFLLTSSAITVIIVQFWVTRRIKRHPPMLMMALGTILFAVGYTLFGIVSTYALFVTAIVVITFGEMIVMPTSQALVAHFAPEAMRGRYMAAFSLAWKIPSTFGTIAAGLIMDHYNPRWVWYLAGIIAMIAVGGFLGLHRLTRQRFAAITPVESTAAAD